MNPASQIEPSPGGAPGLAVRIQDDAPPIVRAMRGDLARRLEDPAFAERTRRVRGIASVSDLNTPQAVTFRVAEDGVMLAHGAGDEARVRVTVDLRGVGEPQLDGAEDEPELAQWLRDLLGAPAPELDDAAATLWAAMASMPGAPAALLVVDLETGDELRFGAEIGRAYELHGTTGALAAVLTGRVPPVDAAFEGGIFVRGSFAELSVLTGAGFRVRYGAGSDGGDGATGDA